MDKKQQAYWDGFIVGLTLSALVNLGWVLLRWHDPIDVYMCLIYCNPKDTRLPLWSDHAASIVFALFRVLLSAMLTGFAGAALRSESDR